MDAAGNDPNGAGAPTPVHEYKDHRGAWLRAGKRGRQRGVDLAGARAASASGAPPLRAGARSMLAPFLRALIPRARCRLPAGLLLPL